MVSCCYCCSMETPLDRLTNSNRLQTLWLVVGIPSVQPHKTRTKKEKMIWFLFLYNFWTFPSHEPNSTYRLTYTSRHNKTWCFPRFGRCVQHHFQTVTLGLVALGVERRLFFTVIFFYEKGYGNISEYYFDRHPCPCYVSIWLVNARTTHNNPQQQIIIIIDSENSWHGGIFHIGGNGHVKNYVNMNKID